MAGEVAYGAGLAARGCWPDGVTSWSFFQSMQPGAARAQAGSSCMKRCIRVGMATPLLAIGRARPNDPPADGARGPDSSLVRGRCPVAGRLRHRLQPPALGWLTHRRSLSRRAPLAQAAPRDLLDAQGKDEQISL